MKSSIAQKILPSVTLHATHFGQYIRIARKRRKLSMADVADRLGISYQTIVRIEKGDPSVSMGAYLSVLWLFNFVQAAVNAAHPDHDETGKALELSRLPIRVRAKRVSSQEHDF